MQSNELKLSVIIPVYNLESYIGDTIESCENQDMDKSQYEIICIDDGSTDQSCEVIKDYQSRYNNIVLIRQENQGVSAARNKGLMHAKGKYIWFVDGDDIVKSNCLDTLFKQVEMEQSDILWFKMKDFIDEIEESVDCPFFLSCHEKEKLYSFMFSKGGGGVCCHWFNAELLKNKQIIFDNRIKYSEDVLFSFQVLMNASVCTKTDGVYYYYRKRSDSATHVANYDTFSESMLLLAESYDELSKNDKYSDWNKIIINKRDFAVKALLFNVMRSGNINEATRYIALLTQREFYPYPLKMELLRGNQTKKQALINMLSFFFPCRFYYFFCVKCISLLKKLRR